MSAMIVTDLLDETAARLPEKTAYVDPERSVKLAEVQSEAKHIAAGLIKLGVRRSPVAVFMDKSASAIIATLGIAYSGNFYTILDTKMPDERIGKILGTLEPKAFIASKALEGDCRRIAGSIPVLVYEEEQEKEMDPAEVKKVTDTVQPSDLFYVCFTSGSTGMPKGVAATHQAMMGFLLRAMPISYGCCEEDVLLNQSPLYFVMSLTDMFMPITNGCTAHFINDLAFAFPGLLMKYIEDHKITMFGLVPSLMQLCVKMNALDSADLSCVKTIVFGGESVPMPVLRIWREKLPHVNFINGYGSTESTSACLHYTVDRDFPDDAILPVGIPDANMDILLLDENDRLTADGEIGEICVRSASLAVGYYNDPKRTAEVFVQNPLQKAYEEKIYRTGDLAYRNERGELEFVGRKDLQIKFMGHRIELGEIEAAGAAVPGVSANACAYDADTKILALFYVGEIDSKDLHRALAEKLPDYMVPRRLVQLSELPRNAHDKTDRVRLKEMLRELEAEEKH